MGLSIRPNSRQIPSSVEYTSDKLYNDLMYGYLQSISLPMRDGRRYVNASDVSFVKLASALNISRQTASMRFKNLQDLYLVGLKKLSKFELLLIGNEFAYLVPNDVLVKLVETNTPHIISMYVRFCELSYKQNQILYHTSKIKEEIGISTNTSNNSHILIDALDELQDLGLLKHRDERVTKKGVWKTKKYVTDITNIL